MSGSLYSLELCAGAGGQAIGVERAGFEPAALVEIEPAACATLRTNRKQWNVIEGDVKTFCALPYRGVDLVCAGVPCPPFSVASKQLGEQDERNLFPAALRIVREAAPRAVMFENVPGLAEKKFSSTLEGILNELRGMGYEADFKVLNASNYGTPQLRPRLVIVAMKPSAFRHFKWPEPQPFTGTVGSVLLEEMKKGGWEGAEEWAAKAAGIAPTLVGGSKKHGGADLGPTRAKQAWAKLCVDGHGLADAPPPPGFSGMPRLTLKMTALLQGFPPEWEFAGKKTPAYRQVGNAFPPQVSFAVSSAVRRALAKAGVTKTSLKKEALESGVLQSQLALV